MDFRCEACNARLTKGIYVIDWLHEIVTSNFSVDLCEECQKHMIDAVKKAWVQIYKPYNKTLNLT